MNPRTNLVLGLLCSAIAVSILAVKLPNYAIFATLALLVVLVIWLILVLKGRREQDEAR